MENTEKGAINVSEESIKAFAKRARELRLERNLTLEGLGNLLGCSRSTVSSYECGVRLPDIKVLNAYSELFEVPVDYLLGKINVKRPLQSIACFSKLTDEDVGTWSQDVQDDISAFIEFRLQQERNKQNKNK